MLKTGTALVILALGTAFCDGCGSDIMVNDDFEERVVGVNGQVISLEDLEEITDDLRLTDGQKRARLEELGIVDPGLIKALLGVSVLPDLPASQDLGSTVSPSERITLFVEDSGTGEDGDRVAVVLNGFIVESDLLLDAQGASISLALQTGENTVDIRALNDGRIPPNSAEFTVIDAADQVLLADGWRLNANEIGRFTVTYEPGQ